jgi:hypothetical protein
MTSEYNYLDQRQPLWDLTTQQLKPLAHPVPYVPDHLSVKLIPVACEDVLEVIHSRRLSLGSVISASVLEGIGSPADVRFDFAVCSFANMFRSVLAFVVFIFVSKIPPLQVKRVSLKIIVHDDGGISSFPHHHSSCDHPCFLVLYLANGWVM